jgi:hypothetical protein
MEQKTAQASAVPVWRAVVLARPATIPRARAAETGQKRISAPRDDTARASCGNGAKANSYHSILQILWGGNVIIFIPLALDNNLLVIFICLKNIILDDDIRYIVKVDGAVRHFPVKN